LLSFPVKLYAAARREPISFRNLRKRETETEVDGHADPEAEPAPLPTPRAANKIALAPKPSAAVAPPPEPVYTSEERVTHAASAAGFPAAGFTTAKAAPVVKGYEFERDHFVAIDPAEIRKLAKSTSRDLEVTEFVHWDEIDPVYLDASYFVVPDPSGEKPYSLLYAAMKKTGFAALAQLAMHGREQILVLRLGRKGLVAHTMFYYAEVRRDEEFTASNEKLNPKELDLAAKLIEQLAEPFQPERYIDAYKARVQALVDAKVQRVPAHGEEAAAEPIARKKPVDILDALKRSLEKAAERKAPQQATQGSPQPASRTKRRSA